MIKRGDNFSLTGGKFTRYYDKADGVQKPKSEDEVLIGVQFDLNGLYAKLDEPDKREFYYEKSWIPMPTDKKEKDKILNKLGRLSGSSDRKQQQENNAWLDSIKVDADLLNMANIDASKLNSDYSFSNMYKYFRTDFMSKVKGVLPQKYDIRDYRYFYKAAMWAKMGSVLRRPPYNMNFPPAPITQIAGGGFSSVGKAAEDVANLGGEMEIIPVLVPPNSSGYQGPTPIIDTPLTSNAQMESMIFTGIPIQGGGIISISQFIHRGGQLPVPLMTVIRKMNLTGQKLTSQTQLKQYQVELLNQLNAELNQEAEMKKSDIIESKGEDQLITQGSTNQQNFNQVHYDSFTQNIFQLLDSVQTEHGMRVEPQGRTNYTTIISLLRMTNADQNQRLLNILNSVGIQISNLRDSTITRDDLNNRAVVIIRNLPISRQVDAVNRIRSILQELKTRTGLTNAQKKYLETQETKTGEQQYRQYDPTELIARLRELFVPSISFVYSAEEANDIFDDFQGDLEGLYTAEIYNLGGYTLENEIKAADEVLKEFVRRLAEHSLDMKPYGDEFNEQAFLTFLNNLFTQFKNRPTFSFSKLIEHINSGELKARLTNLYNTVIRGQPEDIQEGKRMFDIDLNPNQANQGASVLHTRRDIQDLVRDITQYGRDRMSQLIFRVRNFRMYNADISRAHEAAFGVESDNKQPEALHAGIEMDNFVLFEMDTPPDENGARQTIKRFMSLRNLAYLMSLLGFSGAVIGGIIEGLKKATPQSPPIPFPPLPDTPTGPTGPTIPPTISGEDNKTEEKDKNNDINKMTDQDKNATQVNTGVANSTNATIGNTTMQTNSGMEYPLYIDPAEIELFALKKKMIEEENRRWNHFSLVQPNSGLGSSDKNRRDFNPLIRNQVQSDIRRYTGNFELPPPNHISIYANRNNQVEGTKTSKMHYDPLVAERLKTQAGQLEINPMYVKRFYPQYQNHFGKVHFEDDTPGLSMSDERFQPADNGTMSNDDFRDNGLYNPDKGLYLKGVNKPGYHPIRTGEFSRGPQYYGLSTKDYRLDQLNNNGQRYNELDSKINNFGVQPDHGFNFAYDTHEDFPTKKIIKSGIYSNKESLLFKQSLNHKTKYVKKSRW